jgi:hypothetical protein
MSKKKSYFYLKKTVLIDKVEIEEKSVGFADLSKLKQINIHFIRIAKEISIQSNLIEKFDIQKTGDRFSNKICDRCFRYLPTSFFSDNRSKKNAITKRPSCKDCRKTKDGVSVSNKDRELWNTKKPKDFDLFSCPICRKVSIYGITKVVLDHNHHNGKVRGYLCESCNTGIGRFDDNPKIIVNAIKWLRKKD